MRVWRCGRGPALILLQGGMADSALYWNRVWAQPAENFAVVARDWPGFGESEPLEKSTFAAIIDWLEECRLTLETVRTSSTQLQTWRPS